MCLTDCSQSASEHSSRSSQEDQRDQEDRGETKEEDKGNFMDFAVREVAEQLTRLDAVGPIKKPFEGSFLCHCGSLIHIVCPSGTVCQSGALPLPGLRLVPA